MRNTETINRRRKKETENRWVELRNSVLEERKLHVAGRSSLGGEKMMRLVDQRPGHPSLSNLIHR